VKEITTEKNILTENSELLKQYFKDISKYPIYKGEEQVELAKKMRAGDLKARDKLINSNLRFVVTCAKQFVGQGVPLIDLISSGNL
jgi:RNA polymerase primary sigma factor